MKGKNHKSNGAQNLIYRNIVRDSLEMEHKKLCCSVIQPIYAMENAEEEWNKKHQNCVFQ